MDYVSAATLAMVAFNTLERVLSHCGCIDLSTFRNIHIGSCCFSFDGTYKTPAGTPLSTSRAATIEVAGRAYTPADIEELVAASGGGPIRSLRGTNSNLAAILTPPNQV